MIEAMKQALEALYPISHNSTDDYRGQADKAITSLRQAIREHAMYEVQRLGQEIEQEPVAEARFDGTLHWLEPYGIGLHRFQGPLYTHPPQRTWVGLTDEEIDKTHETQVWDARRSYARAIEAKLKEKNT